MTKLDQRKKETSHTGPWLRKKFLVSPIRKERKNGRTRKGERERENEKTEIIQLFHIKNAKNGKWYTYVCEWWIAGSGYPSHCNVCISQENDGRSTHLTEW